MSAPPAVELTTRQLVLVGASGGATVLALLALAAAIGAAAYRLTGTVHRIRTRRAQRRADLHTCQAIHTLPTRRHPTEDPR